MAWFDVNKCGSSGECRKLFDDVNFTIQSHCATKFPPIKEIITAEYSACLDDINTRVEIAKDPSQAAFERYMRRFQFMALVENATWGDFKLVWDKRACQNDERCEKTFETIKEVKKRRCHKDSNHECKETIQGENDAKKSCTDKEYIKDCDAECKKPKATCDASACKNNRAKTCEEITDKPLTDEKTCIEERTQKCMISAAEAPSNVDDYIYLLRILDGYLPAEAVGHVDPKFFRPPQWVIDKKTSAREYPEPPPEPTPVVKKNSVTAHLGAGALMMPGGFNTAPTECRDGTTICWTGTGPLPLNGVGNPTEIKPAGVIITGGFDYARLVWWRLHVGGGVDGMFAYLPTGSTGEPNNDPAGIMAAGLGVRAGAELRFDRWRVRVGGRVGFSYWTLIGGNGTFSLPYIPDVDGKQFSQWSPVAGILAGADFVIRRPIAVGLEGGCAWPLADWSQEVERFGRDYPNPDVTPDRPSPTVTCGIAVRGTYTIKSF